MDRFEYLTLKWGLMGRADSIWGALAAAAYKQWEESSPGTAGWLPKSQPGEMQRRVDAFYAGFKRKGER